VKFVIDTNILFSGLLNSSGKIGWLLLLSKAHFQFYTCEFLRHELLKHKQRLLQLTRLSEDELSELQQLLTQNIIFINESIIPITDLFEAEKLTKDIDPDDTVFVALANHLACKLRTGDKKLIAGLQAKGYENTITTTELFSLYEELEQRKT
jgi:predicted nucleic acid-binding protein